MIENIEIRQRLSLPGAPTEIGTLCFNRQVVADIADMGSLAVFNIGARHDARQTSLLGHGNTSLFHLLLLHLLKPLNAERPQRAFIPLRAYAK